jgi:hypothetical protein
MFLAAGLQAEGAKKKRGKNFNENKVNVVGAFGVSSSRFSEEVMIDLGLEFRLGGPFFLQVLANSHIGEDRYYDRYYDPFYSPYTYYGGNYGSVGLSLNTLHGVSTYGMVKTGMSRHLVFYLKGGISYTFYTDDNYSRRQGVYFRRKINGMGVGGGAGLEYIIGKRFAVSLGGTYKKLITGNTVPAGSIDGLDWLKFHLGAFFRLK